MLPVALVVGGAILGIAGEKALNSKQGKVMRARACKQAHRAAVGSIVAGMKAKEELEKIVEDAKMQFDDIVAEASYEKANQELQGEEITVIEEIDEE